ncbi:MAG: PadR family transcriptional regulator [Candidatus Nealsonbacteria bacterium CG23_combo_of_CG06-09_8_20_14_all_40_13]|uniref:PadR family transcriptional regulator n=1 Tax=Candidatus Nealsonbacteria bacterium CG23_combo_of_CG06-09_8_20_14_all_40_13 TaxID=1974724 RepID=A0A2G9YRR7_9BACT|nr:MAG: PadR family transcriptional regulator [Candidatus Nealsonbacteria bacterium CG23_combo_of_CG06-09_8_20_14_all_40_13]PIR70729.1 MAG: PadR family transcriptional regulator [Candidatus Nealsonbacteria bacterium CG10_big_fil_rev_8_21_14_0_10_40_24]PIU43217.1 MAG: PadR family transcriptional regulator [Candidatus Nealsonbacteria bacterium CG07_land_8_20_14_0_80_40_10]
MLEEKYWKNLINQSLIRFFILRVLKNIDQIHGYQLGKEIASITRDYCRPAESTLYPALIQLQKQGLVQSKTTKINGRTRKVYRLTDKGRTAFRIATKAWNEILPILQRGTLI